MIVSGSMNLTQLSQNGNSATIGITGTATTAFVSSCTAGGYVVNGSWTQSYNSSDTITMSGTPATLSVNINGSVSVPNATVTIGTSTIGGTNCSVINLTDTFNNVSYDPSTTAKMGSVSYQGVVGGQQTSGAANL